MTGFNLPLFTPGLFSGGMLRHVLYRTTSQHTKELRTGKDKNIDKKIQSNKFKTRAIKEAYHEQENFSAQ